MATKADASAARNRVHNSRDGLPPAPAAKPRPKKPSVAAHDQMLLQKAQQQKELLDRAMATFESVAPNREQFAELIGVSKRGLDKWLYPYMPGKAKSEQDCREMPEPVRRLLIIMLEQRSALKVLQRLAKEYQEALQEDNAAPRKTSRSRNKNEEAL